MLRLSKPQGKSCRNPKGDVMAAFASSTSSIQAPPPSFDHFGQGDWTGSSHIKGKPSNDPGPFGRRTVPISVVDREKSRLIK
jgi:hypothetical protein